MKFSAVILAAGEGRRAGGYKPLWLINGRAVIDYIIAAAVQVCSEVIVVGGYQSEQLKNHLDSGPIQVKLRHNTGWKAGGMFSSVQLGLAGLQGPVFIHPADIPGAGSEVYNSLITAFKNHKADVFRPIHSGRPGHPILLSAATIAVVNHASPDSNLREVIFSLKRFDVEVVNDLILFDFNAVDNFEVLKARILAQKANDISGKG